MFTPPRDRGASAVEFALVLPVLLLLVIGILEFGRAYYVQTTLSNAARDGVRVMALQNDAAAAKAAVRSAAGGVELAAIKVDPSNCASAGSTPTATVIVTHDFGLISGLLPLNDFTLTGKGSMRCLG